MASITFITVSDKPTTTKTYPLTGKRQLVHDVAVALTSYGYDVYLSKDGRHGFYTDGKRVVSFGGSWEFYLDYSGNYAPSRTSGTGWQIAKEQCNPPSKELASDWIKANAPTWTGNHNPIYTTPEQHLKTYGVSSGYVKFSPNQEATK